MSEDTKPLHGTIAWVDLTVPEVHEVRDFYREIVGWEPSPVEMGGYEDYAMAVPGSEGPQAGICHARGANADLPACWLVYIVVPDAVASARRCAELGAEVVVGPRRMGDGASYCVIRDPAGAVAALYSSDGG